MVDILPEDTPLWQSMEAAALEVLSSYGYEEIRLPIIESTDLFARSIGEVTDIVEKEMYTFADRNDDSMTLRPEGTAGCVRAVVQHNLAVTPQRLWYMGPMFRYERPQKGRQRQFHQLVLKRLVSRHRIRMPSSSPCVGSYGVAWEWMTHCSLRSIRLVRLKTAPVIVRRWSPTYPSIESN